MQPQQVRNSLYRQSGLELIEMDCLCFPSVRIKGVCQHTLLITFYNAILSRRVEYMSEIIVFRKCMFLLSIDTSICIL